MTIQVGEKIPDVEVTIMGENGPKSVSLAAESAGKRVVLFAVPGAFTPTCTAQHLPGFVSSVDDFLAKGISGVVRLAVNDVFVVTAWGEMQGADRLVMAADSDGSFTRAVGLQVDLSAFGLGERSQRYAMLLEDGVVKQLCVEPGSGLTVSSAENLLALA